MEKTSAITRKDYVWFAEIPTRWIDMDIYGHVNNVQYYSFFDTAVAAHLIKHGGLDPVKSRIIGLVVETKCEFKKSICFPSLVKAGLTVTHIGRSSVKYEIGLFIDEDEEPAATGYFVHVYVERATQRPAAIPEERRRAIEVLKR